MIELASLVPSLPMPLAQLLRRALNSHSPLELHHNAFYLSEAALKLAAAARIGLWLDRALVADHPIAAHLEALAYPSLGQWRDFLRDIDRDLASRSDLGPLPLGDWLGQIDSARDPWQAVAAFATAAVESGAVSEEVGALAPGEGLLGFFNLVVSYRNRVIAHGGQRLSSYYERMGDLLLQALREVLACDALTGDLRLVYARLRLSQADEDPSLFWQDLRGVASLPLDPKAAGAHPLPGPDRAMAGRVCMIGKGGVIPLHPLVVYRVDEAGAESFGFLNRTIRRAVKTDIHPQEVRRADYLDYATGENLTGIDTRAALTALIGRLRGRSATVEDLKAALDASVAEADPDAEPFVVPKGVTIGDFEILEEIGRGGMGVVYRARQCSLNRQVALKVLPPSLAGDSSMLRRFRREMSALARCDHPNVIKILTSGIDDDRYYYAMELVEGADLARASRTLAQWRGTQIQLCEAHLSAALAVLGREEREDKPSERETPAGKPPEVAADSHGRSFFVRMAELFADAANGLDHLHARGILHRDIKPSNLLLTADARRIVVMDLGLARLREVSQTTSRSEVRILGTLRYTAPEQLVRRLADVDYRADLYALGASLYELVTGRPIFDGETESRLIQQILYETPASAREIDPRIPAELAAIIAVATAKDPAARYPSAASLAADLRAFAEGRPIQIASAWRMRPMMRLARKRPVAVAGALIAAVVACAAGVAAWDWNRVRVTDCAGAIRRREVLQCVDPLQAQDQVHRSASFRFHQRRGQVFRVERINGYGQLAADDQGEARWDLTFSETGSLASIAVRDPGAILQHVWVYSPDLARAERRDPDNNPKSEEGTEVSVHRLELDGRGYRKTVMFNNIYGYPIPDQDKSFGYAIEVDARGRVTGIDHLGEDGRPSPTRGGILRETLRYDDAGNEVEHRYLDGKGAPILSRAGVAGRRMRYDAHGNPVELTWLGTDSGPAVHEDGIAGWIATWDDHGNRASESYLGVDRMPAWHKDGYAGWKALYDERGQLVDKTFLDPQASPIMTRLGYAIWRGRYDASGRLAEESYFDDKGKVAACQAGYARRTFEHDSRGQVSRESWWDAQGKPAVTRLGYAGWRAEYDARGNEVLKVFLGSDGQPRVSTYGYAGWKIDHDERGTQLQITYLGADLKTITNIYGYAIVRTLTNSRGDIIESAFFDDRDRPAQTVEGYAIVRRQYDRKSGQVEESYWGMDGKPVLHRRGYFVARMRFDDRGNKVEETFLGLDGGPIAIQEGFASWKASLDPQGREIEIRYFDAAGRPSNNRHGFARRTTRRDEHGNVVEEATFDGAGAPTVTVDGYARWTGRYDSSGHLVEQSFFGLDGKPARHRNGYTVRRHRYDAQGNRIETAWFGSDGKPASIASGFSVLRTTYDDAGNAAVESFLDAEGKPAVTQDGVAGRELRYDAHGRVVELTLLDGQGRAIAPDRGPAIERRQYDGKGRLVGASRAGSDGAPRPDRHGVVSVRFTLDDRGQRVGAECTAALPKTAVSPASCAASAASIRDPIVEEL